MLGRLFAHSIGTEDPNILASIVDPAEPSVHAIELHISWPDGAGPPPSVSIEQEQHQQQVHLRVKAERIQFWRIRFVYRIDHLFANI